MNNTEWWLRCDTMQEEKSLVFIGLKYCLLLLLTNLLTYHNNAFCKTSKQSQVINDGISDIFICFGFLSTKDNNHNGIIIMIVDVITHNTLCHCVTRSLVCENDGEFYK